MSGGKFNYDQYKIGQIADDIEHVIITNGQKRTNQYGDETGYDLPDEIIAQFKDAVRALRVAQVYAHRIDWLLSGDDGEENFIERLVSDLADIGC